MEPDGDTLDETEYGASVGSIDAVEALQQVARALASCTSILDAIIAEVENARQAKS